MSETKQTSKPTRREFFRVAGLGAGAAAVAGVTSGAANAAVEVKSGRRGDAGYRETDHVKQVYELSK
jgi:hypothetical protein